MKYLNKLAIIFSLNSCKKSSSILKQNNTIIKIDDDSIIIIDSCEYIFNSFHNDSYKFCKNRNNERKNRN